LKEVNERAKIEELKIQEKKENKDIDKPRFINSKGGMKNNGLMMQGDGNVNGGLMMNGNMNLNTNFNEKKEEKRAFTNSKKIKIEEQT